MVGLKGETDWEQAREARILAQLVGRGSVRLLAKVGIPAQIVGRSVRLLAQVGILAQLVGRGPVRLLA
jgi:hypothetical protein